MNGFGKKGEVYLALIGDVEGSRRLERRAELQRELGRAVEIVNERLGPALAAPLSLTAGDEIQALFREPAAVVDAMTEVADAVFPARLIHGLGVGTLETDPGPDPALLDGPCFHRAREAVQEARSEGTWAIARGLEAPGDVVVGALFRLVGELRSRWTPIQAEHVRHARGRPQKEVAERLGKAESTVSESLKAAGFQAMLEGETALRAALSRFAHGAEADVGSVQGANRG
ncbi:MAG TPA: SatD family protein [Gemmatimonadota bacterium]|nr:SatD family protein [Gemmatimonadota bacterium]